MLRYLLDTNICIYVLRDRPSHVREVFNRHAAHLCTSSIVLGELLYGAEKSAQPERNLEQIERFMARLEVLAFDEAAAAHFGSIRAELERGGEPIGAYDLMVAGHARSVGLRLVTNNEREFTRVPGLLVENWT